MLGLSILFACKAPVEAPKDLDALLSYLYLHAMDEESESLDAGIENLLEFAGYNEEDLREGFEVSHLSEEAIVSTGEEALFLDEQYGVSLLYDVPFSSEDLAYCYSSIPLEEVYPDDYKSYEREVLTDLDCFLRKECPTVRFQTNIVTALILGAEIYTENISEMRWFEHELGSGFIQRTWMKGEGEATVEWANLRSQYYLGVTYNNALGSMTLAGSWAVLQLGDIPVPEDTAINTALKALKRNGEDVTSYLTENPI